MEFLIEITISAFLFYDKLFRDSLKNSRTCNMKLLHAMASIHTYLEEDALYNVTTCNNKRMQLYLEQLANDISVMRT